MKWVNCVSDLEIYTRKRRKKKTTTASIRETRKVRTKEKVIKIILDFIMENLFDLLSIRLKKYISLRKWFVFNHLEDFRFII